MTRRRARKVWKGTLGSTQVAWSCVEDGVLFGKARSQTTGVCKRTLVMFWCFENGTGKCGRCWCLLRCRRLSVWFSKATGTGLSAQVMKGQTCNRESKSRWWKVGSAWWWVDLPGGQMILAHSKPWDLQLCYRRRIFIPGMIMTE